MELVKAYIQRVSREPYQFTRQVNQIIQSMYKQYEHMIQPAETFYHLERAMEMVLTQYFEHILPPYRFFEVNYRPGATNIMGEFIWSIVDPEGQPIHLGDSYHYNSTPERPHLEEAHYSSVFSHLANEYERRLPWHGNNY